MRVRDPTRKSVLEFRGPVFPIDVTGQEVQCPFCFQNKQYKAYAIKSCLSLDFFCTE